MSRRDNPFAGDEGTTTRMEACFVCRTANWYVANENGILPKYDELICLIRFTRGEHFIEVDFNLEINLHKKNKKNNLISRKKIPKHFYQQTNKTKNKQLTTTNLPPEAKTETKVITIITKITTNSTASTTFSLKYPCDRGCLVLTFPPFAPGSSALDGSSSILKLSGLTPCRDILNEKRKK